MNVGELSQFKQFQPLVQQMNELGKPKATSENGVGDTMTPFSNTSNPSSGPSFVDTMKQFVGDVNTLHKNSADLTESMLKGEPVEIHDVMLAAEKSKTAF